MYWCEQRGKLRWTALCEDLLSGFQSRQLLLLLHYMAGIEDTNLLGPSWAPWHQQNTHWVTWNTDCHVSSMAPVHWTCSKTLACLTAWHLVIITEQTFQLANISSEYLWVNGEIIGLGKPTASWIFSARVEKQSSANEETEGWQVLLSALKLILN